MPNNEEPEYNWTEMSMEESLDQLAEAQSRYYNAMNALQKPEKRKIKKGEWLVRWRQHGDKSWNEDYYKTRENAIGRIEALKLASIFNTLNSHVSLHTSTQGWKVKVDSNDNLILEDLA